jgi:hypothetical protein
MQEIILIEATVPHILGVYAARERASHDLEQAIASWDPGVSAWRLYSEGRQCEDNFVRRLGEFMPDAGMEQSTQVLSGSSTSAWMC